MTRSNNPYGKIFAIIQQINQAGSEVTYKDLVRDFTGGRTTSLKDLSAVEFKKFEDNLIALSTTPTNKRDQYSNDPLDKSRKAIISQFLSIGRTANNAKEWAEKYGVNGVKKPFNDYTGQELFKLIQNAKKVKADFIKSVVKKV